ncbi:TetR/AcrR family transcriptional regulator [Antrihabitans sp. YC3-6]|uniref:TetR/AcrR family transcriptional regulator n=1 Tax=Antrihabitans stalagmiti TaxID=2799499 RepID=A0A934U5W8_9NOCA|nr:TetR/AcrR family transcriptional regulator [Antrihabitans stalagmiti]MBJ8341969.1 TetR/AcrR family transcriptional regulator [Antrihabitans stalagmiti]
MRTRAALIRAAQTMIGDGRLNAPVLEITQAADVGMGSFYNHFESKEDLFQAAVNEALDVHGALLDSLTEGLSDPAEVFAESFRLTGRLHRKAPEISRVLLRSGAALISSDRGLAPRAKRDILAAIEAGRFTVRDPELALVAAAGAVLCLGQLLHDQPERDDGEASDQLAEDLLRMFGIPADEAREICTGPLPTLEG